MEYMFMRRIIVFINGRDEKQIQWYKQSPYPADMRTMLLITDGSYLDVRKKLHTSTVLLRQQGNNREDGHKSPAFGCCSKREHNWKCGSIHLKREIMKRTVFIILLIILFMNPLKADATCPGDSALTDLISAICWECIFPIYIAGVEIDTGSHVNDITESEASTECTCPVEWPPYERMGITISFWPVSYYVEVVKDPYCFPSYGLNINGNESGDSLKSLTNGGGAEMGHEGNETSTFAQAHFWYFYILGMMDEALDTMCEETTSTDLVGLSEIDPLWQDDELAIIIGPEAYLFANYGAQLTCIADAVTTNVGYSLSPLSGVSVRRGVCIRLPATSIMTICCRLMN